MNDLNQYVNVSFAPITAITGETNTTSTYTYTTSTSNDVGALISKIQEMQHKIDSLELDSPDHRANLVVGALYDFAGFITTYPVTLKFGKDKDSAVMSGLLSSFLSQRGVAYPSNPAISYWQECV
jgi:hypothetical protein